MDMQNFSVVGLNAARELIRDGIEAKRPTLLLGPPGIGKTALAYGVANDLTVSTGKQYTVATWLLGLSADEITSGVAIRQDDGSVRMVPVGPGFDACTRPTVLLIDEVSRASATKQGAAMTVVNERMWGSWHLHPDTVIILCGNEPDSGGTHDIVDALLNRCAVFRMQTTRAEMIEYFNTSVGAPDSILQKLATDYASCAEFRTNMFAERPPEGFAESGELWPSGRAVEHGLKRLAARMTRNGEASATEVSSLEFLTLAGTIGRETAAMFFALRRTRLSLPSAEEIVADPANAELPKGTESAIASIAVVESAAKLNSDAAWLYLSRFPKSEPEISAALKVRLQAYPPKKHGTPAFKVFADAMTALKKIRTGA